jgi:hypothetical protein
MRRRIAVKPTVVFDIHGALQQVGDAAEDEPEVIFVFE